MLKKYFFYIFSFLMTITSCKKENLIIIEGVEPLSFDCLLSIDKHQIINDSETYKLFLDTYRNNSQNCLTYISPSIDFTEKTLLGQYIEVTACNVSSISEVFADPSQKRYIYQLQVNLDGTCETRFERLVWIIVPKLPDNYTVTFEANYERI